MSQQQRPNESKPTPKDGASNASHKQDKSNEIIQKSQHSSQDSQQKRNAHTNSASAGTGDDSEDIRERSRNSPA